MQPVAQGISTSTALAIVWGITALGGLFWLAAFAFVVSTSRKINPPSDPLNSDFVGGEGDGSWASIASGAAPGGKLPEGWMSGSAEVEGTPESLIRRATMRLARDGFLGMGPVRILARDDRFVAFECIGYGGSRPLARPAQASAAPFDGSSPTGTEFGPNRSGSKFGWQGMIRARPTTSSGNSLVEFSVEVPRKKGLMIGAWIMLAAGLATLLGLCWALSTYVATNVNPSVRIQGVQMVQAVHLLWPPFLLAGLARSGRYTGLNAVDTFVNNLAFEDD